MEGWDHRERELGREERKYGRAFAGVEERAWHSQDRLLTRLAIYSKHCGLHLYRRRHVCL